MLTVTFNLLTLVCIVGLLPERKNVEELYAKVQPKKKRLLNEPPRSGSLDMDSPPAVPQGPRRLFIFHHAVRVDVTIGKQWVQLFFNLEVFYHGRNLNMPKELLKRCGGPQDFSKSLVELHSLPFMCSLLTCLICCSFSLFLRLLKYCTSCRESRCDFWQTMDTNIFWLINQWFPQRILNQMKRTWVL